MKRILFATAALLAAISTRAATTRDYAQTGLIAHWDAIENAGVGLHSSTTNRWMDLTGNNCNWSLNLNNVEWTDRGLVLKGASGGGNTRSDASTYFANAGIRTIEFVYANAEKRDGLIFVPGLNRTAYLYTDTSGRVGYFDYIGQTVELYATNTFSVLYTVGTGTTLTGVSRCWLNGVVSPLEKMGNYWGAGTVAWIGGRSNGQPFAKGTLFAIRLYDRELTDDERTLNRRIDRVRFFAPSDDFIAVFGEPVEYGVPEPNYGFFTNVTVGTSYTFSCPAAHTNADDSVAVCDGYRLRMTNGTEVAGAANSTSIVYSAETARSMLTWYWHKEYMVTITNLSGGAVLSVDGGTTFFAGRTVAVRPGSPLTVTVQQASGRFIAWPSVPADAELASGGSSLLLPSVTNACSVIVDAFSPTHVWTGAASGDFAADGNWTDAVGTATTAPSGPGTSVFVPEGAASQPTSSVPISVGDFRIGSLTNGTSEVSFTTMTLGTNEVDGTLQVLPGGKISHVANGSSETYKLNVRVDGDARIAVKGSVNVNARGYGPGNGPAPGGQWGYGSHGGGDSPYGCIRVPNRCGSGGSKGGNGGGVAMLDVKGTLTVDGSVTSDAGTYATGGSVQLKAGGYAGKGLVSANGHWWSAAGRISIIRRSAGGADFAGTVRARGGNTASWGTTGGPGSIYIQRAGDGGRGDLTFDNTGAGYAGYKARLRPEVDMGSEPFGTVTVKGPNQTFEINGGVTLRVAKGISTKGYSFSTETNLGGVALCPLPGETAVVDGNVKAFNLTCDAPGATVLFKSDAALTAYPGGSLTLKGTQAQPLSMLPETAAGKWSVSQGAEAVPDVEFVAVSNSTATAVTVSDPGGTDLGGNVNWLFPKAIEPGDPIVWTGADDTAWANGKNWDEKRKPIETDRITIPAGCAHYPVLTSDVTVNDLTLAAGAALSLSGGNLTITNDFTSAADVTRTTTEAISLVGGGDQTLALGGCSYPKIALNKSAGRVRFTQGFAAEEFCGTASQTVQLEFAAGETAELGSFVLSGPFMLVSSSSGTQWKLKATGSQRLRGVTATDSDASPGLPIYAGSFNTNGGNNENWIFDAAAAKVWTGAGGSTDFADPSNWNPAGVPGADSQVSVSGSAGGSASVLLTNDVTVAGLTVDGTEGAATFTARGKLTVRESVEVLSNATVALDYFAEPNVVSNDVMVRTGGLLTHSANGSTEKYKLNLRVGRNMMIEVKGSVDVNAKGYGAGTGPSGAVGNEWGHGSHGGGDYPYGSIRTPNRCGAGGSNGGNGGGVAMLDVKGTLSLDGSVTSDAGKFATGGSIHLQAGGFTGKGLVSANGHWLSGAGRIALIRRSAGGADFAGTVRARGGNTASWGNTGGPGSIYIQRAGDGGRGDLTFDNTGAGSAGYKALLRPEVDMGAEPFGTVTVKGPNQTFEINGGVTLRVAKGISTKGYSFSTETNASGVTLCPLPGETAVVDGDVKAFNLTCDAPGATVLFKPGANVTAYPGGSLTLKGTWDSPLSLLPYDAASTWTIAQGLEAVPDVAFVAVSNSTATAVTISDPGGTDLGGNVNWLFPKGILPGDPIAWTGEEDTSWANGNNWDEKRKPIATDRITVPGGCAHYPVLTADVTVNDLTLAAGSSLALSGGNLTVTNDFTSAADVTRANTETITLVGDGDQTFALGGCSYPKIDVRKTGGSVSFTGGFTADEFRGTTAQALTLAFEAGRQVETGTFDFTGPFDMKSSSSGTRWLLKAKGPRRVRGVTATDSDASPGLPIYAGSFNTDGGNNENWIFDAAAAKVWTGAGGSTDFAEPDNWSPAGMPGPGAQVTVRGNGGDAVAVLATNDVTVAGLTVDGTDGAATFTARGRLTVCESLEILSNATVALDYFAEPNVVSNDVMVRDFGTLTHSANGSTEKYKLNLRAGRDMRIEVKGNVDVSKKGYSAGQGPHPGTSWSTGSSGGGWLPYGSVTAPDRCGSGGVSGGNGGGVAMIDAAGALTLSGTVKADAGTYACGGSVYLQAGTFAGAGTVTANGNYWGAGGRISIIRRFPGSADFAGAKSASGGWGSWGSGGPGSIYIQRQEDNGRGSLLYDNSLGRPGGLAVTVFNPDLDGGRTEFSSVRLQNLSILQLDGFPRRLWRHVPVSVGPDAILRLTNTVSATSKSVDVHDLDMTASSAAAHLGGQLMRVRTPTHRNGKGWIQPEGKDPIAAHVSKDEGDIIWVSTALLLIVK